MACRQAWVKLTYKWKGSDMFDRQTSQCAYTSKHAANIMLHGRVSDSTGSSTLGWLTFSCLRDSEQILHTHLPTCQELFNNTIGYSIVSRVWLIRTDPVSMPEPCRALPCKDCLQSKQQAEKQRQIYAASRARQTQISPSAKKWQLLPKNPSDEV